MSDDKDKVINLEEIRKKIEEGALSYSSQVPDDPWLKQLNEKHAFIHSFGGKPCVTNYVYNVAFGKEILEFISPTSFEMIYSNQTIKVHTAKATIDVEMGKWWIRNTDRRQYQTVIFDPTKPKEYNNCLNLWEGFSVVATFRPLGWKYTLKHIYTILCNSDRNKFIYIIKWLAWLVQNPGERAQVAIVFKGLEGTGKGFLLSQFVEIFGRHAMHISNREHLTGKFNGHLGLCCFLFADEAFYPGDKQVAGTMKQLITEEKIPIERKGAETIISKNNLHVAMATNEEWVINASENQRRFFINKVEDRYAKGKLSETHRKLYFSRLFTEMNHGGREAMLFDLLNMNIGDFHPRYNIPDTEELQVQIKLSRDKLKAVVFEILDDGLFPGNINNGEYEINSTAWVNYLNSLDPILKTFSSVKKTDIIKKLQAIKKHTNKGNVWVFPALLDMRKSWDELYGKEKWSNIKEWQIIKGEY